MNDAREDEDLFRFASLDAGEGPATPLSDDATDALVRGVLDAALPPPAAPGSGSAPASGFAHGKAAVGVATLALVTAGLIWSLRTPDPAPSSAPIAHPSVPVETPVAPVEVTREAVAPPVEPTTVAPPEGETIHLEADASTPTATPEPNAVDLLAEANRLRRAGDYGEAEATYLRVVQANPRAREAHVARVAAAAIRLDRLDDPAGAARLYRDAARGSGALAAEATFGLARATRSLGDTAAETQALRALVERYPSSPYVRVAVDRLLALGITVTPEER